MYAINWPIAYRAIDHKKVAIWTSVFLVPFVTISTGLMFVGVDLGAPPEDDLGCTEFANFTGPYHVYLTLFNLAIVLWVVYGSLFVMVKAQQKWQPAPKGKSTGNATRAPTVAQWQRQQRLTRKVPTEQDRDRKVW